MQHGQAGTLSTRGRAGIFEMMLFSIFSAFYTFCFCCCVNMLMFIKVVFFPPLLSCCWQSSSTDYGTNSPLGICPYYRVLHFFAP